MFVRTRDYEKAIKSVRIEFGKAIGCEKDKDAFICVKELPVLAVSKLKTEVDKGLDEALECFKEVLPTAIISHNLYETEEALMTNQAVTDFLYEKSDLVVTILEKYTSMVFFIQESKGGKK